MALLTGFRRQWVRPTGTRAVSRVRPVVAKLAVKAADKATGASAPAPVGQLGTVISGDKKANWLAPNGGSMAAKGVVLFMHGFSQGPNAYYKMLEGLANAGFLVVAPEPPFAPTPKEQQSDMVEFAEHFRSKLVANQLTGLPLPSRDAASNIALLGHSVGAGLATHVAQMAAAQKQPYKAVMYLAPQTKVVKDFSPSDAINSWPADLKDATEFALQYGLEDDLAPPDLSTDLIKALRNAKLKIQDTDITVYGKGTHVGFQDQVVLGDAEITSDVLPWLNPLLLFLVTSLSAIGIPFLPWITAQLLQKRLDAKLTSDDNEAGEAAAANGTAPSSGGLLAAGPGASAGPVASAVLQKAFLNPQDIALLEQALQRSADKTPRAYNDKRAEQLQAWTRAEDGIGEPEEVRFASAEATIAQYTGLLLVVGIAFLGLANSTLQGWLDGGNVNWLSLLGAVVTGYFTYEGAYNLMLLNYVMNTQRPESREEARKFIERELVE